MVKIGSFVQTFKRIGVQAENKYAYRCAHTIEHKAELNTINSRYFTRKKINKEKFKKI